MRGLTIYFSLRVAAYYLAPLGTELMRKTVGETIEGVVVVVWNGKICTEEVGAGVHLRDQDNRGMFLNL